MCILLMRDKADFPDESKPKNPHKKTAVQVELEFIPPCTTEYVEMSNCLTS